VSRRNIANFEREGEMEDEKDEEAHIVGISRRSRVFPVDIDSVKAVRRHGSR
jgi:hypothetical protein